MKYCTLCGKLTAPDSIKGGLCSECRGEQTKPIAEAKHTPEPVAPVARPSKVILTTALEIPGRNTDRIVDVIAAEAVVGLNVFKDIANSWRDFVGGRSATTQEALKKAREECMAELRKEAESKGADAVIAIDIDYNQVSTSGSTGGLLLVVASGTAVTLTPA